MSKHSIVFSIHEISLSFLLHSTYELYLQMQHFRDHFLANLPMRSDPRLLQGISFQDNLVPWDDPRAVCRICLALHVDPVFLVSDARCPFSSGAGLCPVCATPFGTSLPCVGCTEHREHFQVMASVVCWHAGATSKDAFVVVLIHLFSVSQAAVGLILEATTARVLPSNSTILFRAHARLLVGNVPGVNAVSRGVNLPHYLSFARSAQTLDPDPLFGFVWSGFLQAVSGRTLTSVNPRPCLVGVLPRDVPAGGLVNPQVPVPLDAYLDVHAASAVNNFVNAWDEHHQNGIRDDRIQEPRAVASVVFPGARAASPGAGQGVPFVSPVPPSQAAVSVNHNVPVNFNQNMRVENQSVQFGQPRPMFPSYGPASNAEPQISYEQALAQLQQRYGQQFVQQPPVLLPQPQLGNPPIFYHNQFAQQPQVMSAQHYSPVSPAQRLHEQNTPFLQNPQYPVGQHGQHQQQTQVFPQQSAQLDAPRNVPLHDFSFFPPNHSMNASAAAQLGKSATIAGAHNTWLRKNTFSQSIKIQSFPRGADSVDGKARSRPFDIPYASNSLFEQYVFISDEPIQISQREHILVCFVQTCIAWSFYILPLTGNDPRRLPVHVGQMSQVLANIRELASMFGTTEAVVLRVCHFISVRNITSCLNPGDTITLQDPLDVSTNYFQAALAKFIADSRGRVYAPQQQQGYRRPLAMDGDAPARQGAAPQRQRPNNFRGGVAVAAVTPGAQAPVPAAAVPMARNDQTGRCNKFWWGQSCFIHRTGQPCPYRHLCKTCGVIVTAAEAVAHLQSHI